MADPEIPGTLEPEAPAAEPTPSSIETDQAAAAQAEAPLEPEKSETDWRESYKSERRTSSRLARRLNEASATNRELVEAIRIIRTQQEAIAKATLPPEQADALIAQSKAAEDAAKTSRSQQDARNVVLAQQRILTSTLEQIGLDPKQIDWADDATSLDEWTDRVHASIQSNVAKGRDGLLRSVDRGVKTRTAEIEKKLKDEQRRVLKEAGADKIDTAQGSPSTFAQLLASTDPNSKEFEALTERALRGDLRGIAIR